MASNEAGEQSTDRLRRQRNAFAMIAALSLASIALALPRRVANHRDLRALTTHLVDLQAEIVVDQALITEAQGKIIAAQREIAREEAQ